MICTFRTQFALFPATTTTATISNSYDFITLDTHVRRKLRVITAWLVATSGVGKLAERKCFLPTSSTHSITPASSMLDP